MTNVLQSCQVTKDSSRPSHAKVSIIDNASVLNGNMQGGFYVLFIYLTSPN